MALVPTGRLTFQQIRDLAVRKAGNTQLGVPLTNGPSPATIYLTQILFDLYTQYEWPVTNKTIPALALGGTSFVLPLDFYESEDDQSLIVTSSDGQLQASVVLETDPGTFAMMQATQALGTVPYYWTVDRQNGQGLLFPDCSAHTNIANFRYRSLPLAETTPPTTNDESAINAVVPVFPSSRYLIQALFVEILQYERDPRYDAEKMVLESMKKEVLTGLNVLNASAREIPLDADVFRKPFRGDNTMGG